MKLNLHSTLVAVANTLIFTIALLLVRFNNVVAQQPSPTAQPRANSGEITRHEPSATAKRIGSAVQWRGTLDIAINESRLTGKPVFWYVPTLDNSFMDRKVELDRYMLAGFFSWPKTIDTLNEYFIPVRAIPDANQQREYKLVPFRFIEPGFVILNGNGQPRDHVDRINTQHVDWFLSRLAVHHVVAAEPNRISPLTPGWKLFANRKYAQLLEVLPHPTAADNLAAETLLLKGMAQFRLGQHEAAAETWRQASLIQPNHPLAWKAAAEAEGFGPFCRGFEVHVNLPNRAIQHDAASTNNSSAPPNCYAEPELWRRGIDFLLGMQSENGGFHDCDYDFGGTDSLPNIHVAVTSIAGMALLKARQRKQFAESDVQRIDRAIGRAIEFVSNPDHVNLADSDERFWALAYQLRFLSAVVKNAIHAPTILPPCVQQLQANQLKNGSWFHEYPNPFVTGLALLALKEASNSGAAVDAHVVQRGIQSLQRNHDPGGYTYFDRSSGNNESSANLAESSAGRLPVCELGLRCWNATSEAKLTEAIRTSFAKQAHLLSTLKYDNHTSRYGYGGFFFWFDMHGRSDAIASLSPSDTKQKFAAQLRQLVISLPEIDGCFVDSHELGRCYGTSMALLCLANATVE